MSTAFPILFLISSFYGGASFGQPAKQNVHPAVDSFKSLEEQFLGNVRCKENVYASLQGKGMGGSKFAVTREWTRISVRGNDGSTVLLSPTTVPGIWVKARLYLNREAEITQMTPKHTRMITFDINRKNPSLDKCTNNITVKKATRRFDKERMAHSFTDKNFIQLLKKNRRGVIYIWSPAMPYSYSDSVPANGIASIKLAVAKIQKSLGVDVALDYAVDPNSDPKFVKDIINAEQKMDMSMGKPVQSLELFLRMMHHHYPSVIVYSHGKIARFMYPGVESADQYANYIKEQLDLLEKKR